MKTILVADTKQEARMLIHITLSGPRYRIIETSDGKEALEIARREKPDLLLLDWMIPLMDRPNGLEVAETLRRDPYTQDIPIIMLSAVGSDKDKQVAYKMGILAYIVKPFSPLALRERVQALLE